MYLPGVCFQPGKCDSPASPPAGFPAAEGRIQIDMPQGPGLRADVLLDRPAGGHRLTGELKMPGIKERSSIDLRLFV